MYKERGDEHHDQTSEQEIVNREAGRQEFVEKYLLDTALAQAEALRRVEVWDDAGSLTAGNGHELWVVILLLLSQASGR